MKKIISIILLIISISFFSLSIYIFKEFNNIPFEQLLYSLKFSEGTGQSVIIGGLKYCLPIVVLMALVLFIPIFVKVKKKIYLVFKSKKSQKSFKLRIFPVCPKIVYAILISIVLIFFSLKSMGILEYLNNLRANSSVFEKYYVSPNDVKITFPKDKKNLIYIYLESMESSYSSMIIDGKEVNVIPNLTSIAKENINFSDTTSIGGAYQISGATWTAGGIVASSAGIPLKFGTSNIDVNKYDHYSGFLPGVITLGDILKKEGYVQEYLIGSSAHFGGRDLYFQNHGSFNLLDYDWAKKNKKIPDDYYVFWGFEDKKLFEFAKEELQILATNEEPFNLTMLTVDTHFPNGYLDSSCKSKYSYTYANAIECSDSMVGDFISWVMKQDFYENTVIVLSGDHQTMQGDMKDHITSVRPIYNAFINASFTDVKSKNRTFNLFDMFPTTLGSMGVEIEGNRLGLGTNLFSSTSTLSEELGVDYMREEVAKNSKYYNDNFLKETYYEILTEN